MNSSGDKLVIENGEEVIKILSNHFKVAQNEKHQSELIKTIAKFDVRDLSSTRNILKSKSFSEIAQQLLLNNAIISNYEKFPQMQLENDDLLDAFLKIGYKSELRYLDIFADTMSLVLCCHNRLQIDEPYQIFQLVLDYYDIPDHHINSSLLNLFKNFIQWSFTSHHEEMLSRIIGDLFKTSWCSKKKYILLATVFSSLNVDVITSHPIYKTEDLLKGLEFSLTLSHLLSPGQTLHASIYKIASFREIIAQHLTNLIWTKNQQTVENIIRHRISICDEEFRKQVAHILQGKISKIENNISIASPKFKLILRMKTIFNIHINCAQIDNLAKNFACTEMEISDKIIFLQYFSELSIHHMDLQKQIDFILTFLRFIRYNMNQDNSNFSDSFVKSFSRLLLVFERKKFRQIEVLRNIFNFLSFEIIQHGFEFGSYQTTSCSLKFLRSILNQYFIKNTTIDSTRKQSSNFGQFLSENEIFDKNKFLIYMLQLIENEDHSDLKEICIELFLDYFWDEQSLKLICERIDKLKFRLSDPAASSLSEIEVFKKISNVETLRLEILKQKGEDIEELKKIIDSISKSISGIKSSLKITMFNELKQNPKLFEKLASLNYLIKFRTRSSDYGTLYQICQLYKDVADTVLSLLNEPDTPMTFEILYDKIQELKINCSIEHSKDDIINFMFYTLRACSEFSIILVDNFSTETSSSDGYFEVLGKLVEFVIDINTKILTECCHKGAIEAAREAIGKVTRYISENLRNQKRENTERIFIENMRKLNECIFYDYNKVRDIRAARGLMFMVHEIIANHPQFFEKFMSLVLTEEMTFSATIHPLQLHILAKLIKDSKITNSVMTKYDKILFATIQLFKTAKEYVIINGLLQVLGSLVPKISIQKRHIIENDIETKEDLINSAYEHKDVSVRNFNTRFQNMSSVVKKDLALEANSIGALPQIYIIVILQILSAFENSYPSLEEVDEILKILFKLMHHRCEKIRMLSAKCASLWIEERAESSQLIESSIMNLFTSNENLQIATTRFLTLSILRFYHSVVIEASSLLFNLRSIIRLKVSQLCFESSSFYVRCYLLDFLLFIGFGKDDDIIIKLKCSANAKVFHGYNLWREKINMLE